MAQLGKLVLFTSQQVSSPEQMIASVLDSIDASRIILARRTLVEDRQWDIWCRWTNSASDDAVIHEDNSSVVYVDEDDIPTETVGRSLAPRDAPSLYRDHVSLTLEVEPTEKTRNLSAAIGASIDRDIRGAFVPVDPIVTVGFHDIFETAEHDEGHLFGRAFFSFRLLGYGTPNDWIAYRSAVFRVPALDAFKRELEAVAGALECCVYWST